MISMPNLVGSGAMSVAGINITVPITAVIPQFATLLVSVGCSTGNTIELSFTDNKGNIYYCDVVGQRNASLWTGVGHAFITNLLVPGDAVTVNFGTSFANTKIVQILMVTGLAPNGTETVGIYTATAAAITQTYSMSTTVVGSLYVGAHYWSTSTPGYTPLDNTFATPVTVGGSSNSLVTDYYIASTVGPHLLGGTSGGSVNQSLRGAVFNPITAAMIGADTMSGVQSITT